MVRCQLAARHACCIPCACIFSRLCTPFKTRPVRSLLTCIVQVAQPAQREHLEDGATEIAVEATGSVNQTKRVCLCIALTAILSIASVASALESEMISGASAGQPSESTLNREVKAALAHDPLINASEIRVTTQGRMVTLSGTAGSRQVAKRAEQLTSQVNGVKGVEDYIHYATSPSDKNAIPASIAMTRLIEVYLLTESFGRHKY